MQWHPKTNCSTPSSTSKCENAKTEPIRSVNTTPIKRPVTPKGDLTPKRDLTPRHDLISKRELTPRRGCVEAEEPLKIIIATPSKGGLMPVVPDVAIV
jgi:hypothetical protein